MESYFNEEKEKELNIQQLLFCLLDNFKWILLGGIIFGVLFGAVGYYKTYKDGKEGANKASLQDIISQNRTKWYAIDTSVTADAFGNPPVGAYMANSKLYVDFDYSNIEGNNNLDFSAMNTRVEADLNALAGSNEIKQSVIDKLDLHSYDDMKDLSCEDMRYLLNIGFAGANIMQITVIDVNPDRAVAISQLITEEVIEKAADYESVDNIRIYEPTKLIHEGDSADITNKDCVFGGVKYGILGWLIGAFLVCGYCFILFNFRETVRTVDDLDFIEMNTFGIIPEKKDKRDREFKRLAYDIMFMEKTALSIIPVDNTVAIDDINELMIKKVKSDCKIKVTENIIDNPDVILEAKSVGEAILLVSYGKTTINDLVFVKNEMEKAKVNVLGTVILGVRHCK